MSRLFYRHPEPLLSDEKPVVDSMSTINISKPTVKSDEGESTYIQSFGENARGRMIALRLCASPDGIESARRYRKNH